MKEKRSYFSKKGFTLVELLAVIIILGIILILAVPRVSDMINKYRDKAYERQLDFILKAAELYSIFYEDEIEWDGNEATITLKHLQDKDLIASPTKNPKGGDFNLDEVIIILTRDENGLISFQYQESFWLDFEITYENNNTGYFTNEVIIPRNCVLYVDAVDSFGIYLWQNGGEIPVRYTTGEWYDYYTGEGYEFYRTIEFLKGDRLFITGSSFGPADGSVILRLDDEFGEKVAEFDVVLESSCYLTTAMVVYYGKAIDGPELNTMRALRERYRDEYAWMLYEYAEISPRIIKGIEQSGNRDYYYQQIKNVVTSIIDWIEDDEWEVAGFAYLDLYNWLKEEFNLTI